MSNFSNTYVFLILAILAGMMMPTQGVVNTKLATFVDSPILAAFISFAVGTIALFIFIIATGIPLSSLASTKDAPPISWIGGLLGAFFVSAVATSIPRLGVALTFSLAIAGQMLITLILDHFGFLGIPVKEISFARILGAILITAGVILIRRF